MFSVLVLVSSKDSTWVILPALLGLYKVKGLQFWEKRTISTHGSDHVYNLVIAW